MGAPPQPMELAQLKGAVKKNPQRYPKNVKKSRLPIGDPPEGMSEKAKAAWFEICALAIPGVLTGADRITLEAYANLLVFYRQNPADFTAAMHGVKIRFEIQFGMTPSARRTLGSDLPNEPDEYEEFQ